MQALLLMLLFIYLPHSNTQPTRGLGKRLDLTALETHGGFTAPISLGESGPPPILHEGGESLHISKIMCAPFHPWKPLHLLPFPLPGGPSQSVPGR